MKFFLLLIFLVLAGCQPESRITELHLETAPGSAEPRLVRGPLGEIVLSYLEPDIAGTALRFTLLEGDRWQPIRTVAQGENWLVNWADFPSVVPLGDGLWAAHWLIRTEGDQYAYEVAIAQSKDAGFTWGAAVTPHSDGTLSEHGFVSLFPAGDQAAAVWLDGREYADTTHAPNVYIGTQLRATIIGPDNTTGAEVVVDDLVCDCCQTAAAIAASGPVIVYRNRTSDEIRDIYVTRLSEGKWQRGRRVARDGWRMEGCPVNGPAIAAAGPQVAVAWYTAVPNDRVQVAFSSDSADVFAAAIDVGAAKPLGRVAVVLLDDGAAVVSWLESATPGRLRARRVSMDGELGPILEIAPVEVARNSGFPQMVADGNRLLFAWTDVSGETSRVKTVYYQR